MRLRSEWIALMTCWLCATGAQAGTISFSDGEFDDAAWEVELFNFHTGGSASAAQVATGGNPDAYRRVDLSTNAATDPGDNAAIYVFHGFSSAVVDPGSDGAIVSVDYFWDVRALEGAFGQGGFFGPALRQGDRFYVSAGMLELVGTSQEWRAVERLDLTAAAFGRIQDILEIDPAEDPDFSASGEPITFGIFSALAGGLGGPGISLSHAYDNWQVVIETAPEPSGAALMWITAAMLGLRSTGRSRS